MTKRISGIRLTPTGVVLVATLCGLGVWLILAQLLIPGLIREGWSGQGIGILNRFFASRSSKKSLEYYLNLWIDFRNAITIGFLSYYLIVHYIKVKVESINQQILLIVLSGFFLALSILWGPRQDYVAHINIWQRIQSGDDPWWIQPDSGIILNAYGPLFNLLAWPAMISSLAPKIIFVFSYLVYCIYLVGKTKEWKARLLMTFWCFSPFFWLEIAFYGHFDVMVGLFVVAAIVFASEGHEIKSAINIAMGFLLKFLPIVFLPFLAIDLNSSKKLRTRFIIVSIFSIFIGMAASWRVWGESTFRPLGFASARGSALISFWRFIRGKFSPLGLFYQPVPDLDFMATPVLLIILIALWLYYLKYRVSVVHACIMAILAVLIFYRVGFLQYQMVLFLILPIFYIDSTERIKTSWPVPYSSLIYVIWITGFDLFDNAVGGIIGFNRPYGWVEEWAGLPQFLFGGFFLIALFRMGIDENVMTPDINSLPDHQNAPMKKVK